MFDIVAGDDDFAGFAGGVEDFSLLFGKKPGRK
jgi:hypothetical protein